MPDLSIVRHERERQFAAAFFDHDQWEYEPGPYHLSDGTKYIPDFLDKKRNVLIEVVGTRQAYSSNKEKYFVFISEHKDKVLEFRTKNGSLIDYGPKAMHGFSVTPPDMKKRYGINFPTNAIARYIAETNTTPSHLAAKIKVPPSTVHRHLHEHRHPTLDVIAKYVSAGVPIDFFTEQILAMAKLYHGVGIPWEELLLMVPEKTDGSETEGKEDDQ